MNRLYVSAFTLLVLGFITSDSFFIIIIITTDQSGPSWISKGKEMKTKNKNKNKAKQNKNKYKNKNETNYKQNKLKTKQIKKVSTADKIATII